MLSTTIALFDGVDLFSLIKKSSRLNNLLSAIMTKQFCVLLPATEHNLISYFRQRNYHNVVIIDRKDYSAMNESLKDHIVADPQQYQALLSSAKYSLSLKSLSV